MAFILFNVVVSTGALILPGVTGALAERDLWLSPVWGALVGAIALLLAFGLHRLYPNETVIQQAPRILRIFPWQNGWLSLSAFPYHANGSQCVSVYRIPKNGIFTRNT